LGAPGVNNGFGQYFLQSKLDGLCALVGGVDCAEQSSAIG
jgi:hypothetical protein